jgi:23S rRNA pseudouridine1911/1915/1917 synthase
MPCHRLDAPTGGLLIAAKSRLAIRKISRQFEEREISKTYRAIVCGRVDGEGTIDMPLSGKESLSLYKALRVCPSRKHGEVTLVELSPRTGRTHQLRRHMSQGLGKPLVGDRIYAGGDVPVDDVGLMLWATKIEFAHPVRCTPLFVRFGAGCLKEGFCDWRCLGMMPVFSNLDPST